MQIKQLPSLFEPARPVLRKIEQAGFEAYFVGGSVRDTILGDEIHDIDIATSAYPSEIKAIFKRTVDTGIQHGTVMILDHGTGYETTTFRTESGYQDFRRPDHVTFVRSLKDDLKRRDFTINALAMKEDGTVIDLFDGITDLKRHLIRAVGNPEERFHEDALRMMRAVRFAAKLNFSIDSATLQGIQNHGELLKKIAIERIEVEFTKLLLGLNPQRGLEYFLTTNLYQYCPLLKTHFQELKDFSQHDDWSLITNDFAAWLGLLYALQIFKPLAIKKFMKAWKLSNSLISEVQRAMMVLLAVQNQQVNSMILFKAGQSAVTVASQIADFNRLPHQDLQKMYKQLPIKKPHELAIDGDMLIRNTDIQPGPLLGKVIHQLLVLVVQGEINNDPNQLLQVAQDLLKKG
ncbi:CCA tRNA nucleotidyltransferase [uncultured Limosilactobacillus sp.]|uniref:CCA tRNA nucleotidyltransferase n=1 Tax=uncultured Limosilactobacillus sp. TaxID=2837629 RepID=UPI0025E77828|nr:CCA tRNA nucleotidyltransferase [uncultured Limosilactobacillus sp.]